MYIIDLKMYVIDFTKAIHEINYNIINNNAFPYYLFK